MKCPFLCYYRLIIRRQGKIREFGLIVDIFHKILNGFGVPHVLIGYVCSEILCYYRLIIQGQGKIRQIRPLVDVPHKILDRFGIPQVLIG